MESKIIKFNQHYLPILLIICGGPIGKKNNKTAVLSNTATPVNKKHSTDTTEAEKKTGFNKTK